MQTSQFSCVGNTGAGLPPAATEQTAGQLEKIRQ